MYVLTQGAGYPVRGGMGMCFMDGSSSSSAILSSILYSFLLFDLPATYLLTPATYVPTSKAANTGMYFFQLYRTVHILRQAG